MTNNQLIELLLTYPINAEVVFFGERNNGNKCRAENIYCTNQYDIQDGKFGKYYRITGNEEKQNNSIIALTSN